MSRIVGLDDPKVNVKEYFKNFIKHKKIDELMAGIINFFLKLEI